MNGSIGTLPLYTMLNYNKFPTVPVVYFYIKISLVVHWDVVTGKGKDTIALYHRPEYNFQDIGTRCCVAHFIQVIKVVINYKA